MFKPNRSHTQTEFFAFGPHLSDRKRQQLEDSEKYQFYQLTFRQIPEAEFAVLYSEAGSRRPDNTCARTWKPPSRRCREPWSTGN